MKLATPENHPSIILQCPMSELDAQLETTPILTGHCFCGTVSFTLSSAPVLSAYCHCTICQRLNACPFVHTMHFEKSAFKWTHEEPHESYMDAYSNPESRWKTRWRCKTCGSNVSSYNSKTSEWSVWGCQLDRDNDGKIKNWDIVKPTAHIFYGSRVLDVGDGLGKWEGYANSSVRYYNSGA